jgi:diguanylate cyclase (GGDEF)-like protein
MSAERSAANNPGGDEQALIARDTAELLYRHGVGGTAVTTFTSTLLAAIVISQVPARLLWTWWALIIASVLTRGFNIWAAIERRKNPDWDGRAEIRRFALPVLLSGVIWAVFPILFFPSLDELGRTSMAIVLAGMGAGAVTVFAASESLAIPYSALLIIPAALRFVFAGGRENFMLGVLGILFFGVMAISAKVAHHSTVTAIRLNRRNQVLLAAVIREQQRAEHANADLQSAQVALREINQSLELRIQARTADLEHSAKELARLGSIDSLTGLLNRATLGDHLGRTLADASRDSRRVAVFFVDLDKFKEVNDVRGHLAGDQVLRVIAERLWATVPPDTDVARWGGDEFVIPLVHLERPPTEVAEELRSHIAAPISVDDAIINIDATIGVSLFPDHGRAQDELIRAADVAMYAAKQSNEAVRVFDPALGEHLVNRHLLEHALHEAIEAGSLSLTFQPIMDADTSQCRAMEALVRWNHPERGPIEPSEFIPLAENSGEIVALGRWVLREACHAASFWPGDSPPAVSVNVSPLQLLHGSFVADVADTMARVHLPAYRLHLEITETAFIADHGQVTAVLADLRERGIQISLDDFGTGFSSLASLRNLPVDAVKIDRSFVREMDSVTSAIIEAIVSLADALEFQVVAEGVETEGQKQMLQSMGVKYLQGHYLARPMDPAQTAQWLLQEELVMAHTAAGDR